MDEPQNAVTFAAGAAAFGDGSHPSTRGILAALDSIDPALFTPRNACDMGCGSGILSLALARMFACPVVAVDIAAEAVGTVRENARQNGLSDYILPVQNAGFFHPAVAANAPYDLILMNILAGPLVGLAAAANAHLAPDGVLILAGILQWQEAHITEVYQSLGLELTSRLTIGEWVTLVWQKPGEDSI